MQQNFYEMQKENKRFGERIIIQLLDSDVLFSHLDSQKCKESRFIQLKNMKRKDTQIKISHKNR